MNPDTQFPKTAIFNHVSEEMAREANIERAIRPETENLDGTFEYYNGLPTAESFLAIFAGTEYADRLAMLQEIMSKIKLIDPSKPHPKVVVDFSMPPNVGGYFDRTNPDCIVVNPLKLLEAGYHKNFHIIQHETDHYCGIYEESLTDALAHAQRRETGAQGEVETGYKSLTDLLADKIGLLTSKELLNLIVLNDDEATLLNFLDLIINDTLIELGSEWWNIDKVAEALRAGWRDIQELFPRTLHGYFRTGAGYHETATALYPDEHLITALNMRLTLRLIESGKFIEGTEIEA
jgi:hypothetical protein